MAIYPWFLAGVMIYMCDTIIVNICWWHDTRPSQQFQIVCIDHHVGKISLSWYDLSYMGNRHLCNPVCAGFLLFKSQPCSTGKGYPQRRRNLPWKHIFPARCPPDFLAGPLRPDGFVNYVQPCLEKGVALEGKATFHTSLPSHSLLVALFPGVVGGSQKIQNVTGVLLCNE